MDRSKHLILIKGEESTGDVKYCKYNPQKRLTDVTFNNGKTFSYRYENVEWIQNPLAVNPDNVHIKYKERELRNIRDILVFRTSTTAFWYILFQNGKEMTKDKRELVFSFSCLNDDESKNCMNYLRQLASIHELKSEEDNKVLLNEQYEKLTFVDVETVMAAYLNPHKNKLRTYQENFFIFPFGGNASQTKAVINALTSQLSIIQGPPGTGKTQTILNIIANLLVSGKTILVVSNNNAAIQNVLDKMSNPQYNLDFTVAFLGNSAHKKEFIENQTGRYPILAGWELNDKQKIELKERINYRVRELTEIYNNQERLAQVRTELNALDIEEKYFTLYFNETGLLYPDVKFSKRLNSKQIIQLWNNLLDMLEKERAISFLFKLKCSLFYGIYDWSIYNYDLSTIIPLVQRYFYQVRGTELVNEIDYINICLASKKATDMTSELTQWSLTYLRSKLFERYGGSEEREKFTEDDLWKHPVSIASEYPVVLSTAFSSRSSLKGVTFDYLIMDEASQVDVVTGALALSCAKNAVIVGDLQQLPPVVTNELQAKYDAINKYFVLPQGYYQTDNNSILNSVCSILSDAPQTLLREHYRCHPKIIGFCNQKFYNNELIVMTEDYGEPDVMKVFKTVVGNHRRERINRRQIDVIIQETLPMLNGIDSENIGIISPYKKQVDEIAKILSSRQIDVDTVHKFQGREKDVVIITPVDEDKNDFSDDPYLLNVAISRAKERLYLVTSNNEQPTDSNIGDLVSYIEYNNFEIVQSEIHSVFDLLYNQYTDERIAFLKKHSRVSEYDSENLMYATITDILAQFLELPLSVICRQPLNMLIRDFERLDEDERRYAKNPLTHVDFLVYNRISKKSVFAIEVDGFHYHKEGTVQYERDRMKGKILEVYGIPLLRFPTNGSGEREKIHRFLAEYAKGSRC